MDWWSYSNWQTTFIRSRIIWNFKSDLCISRKTWSRIPRRGPPQRRAIRLHDFRLMCVSDLSYQQFVDKWRWTTIPTIFVNSNTFKMSSDRFDLHLRVQVGVGAVNVPEPLSCRTIDEFPTVQLQIVCIMWHLVLIRDWNSLFSGFVSDGLLGFWPEYFLERNPVHIFQRNTEI
jgi:hypothetical protein